MSDLVFVGAVIARTGGQIRLLRRARVIVRGSRVLAVQPAREATEEGAIHLGKGDVLAPGFIDAHAHWSMAVLEDEILRRRDGDTTTRRIARYDEALAAAATPTKRAAVARAATEALSGGTTTAWVRLHVPDMVAAIGPRRPRLVLGATVEAGPTLARRLEAARALAKGPRAAHAKTYPSVVLHEAGLPEDVLRELGSLARNHPDGPLPAQAHVAQRPEESEELGESSVNRLRRTGLLTSGAFVAVHASYSSDHDLRCLAEAGVTVAYCPVAARRAGAPIPCDRLPPGVRLLLATDTPPFRMGPQILEACDSGGISPVDAFDAATWNPAVSLRIPAGAIAPGRLADLNVWTVGDAAIEAGLEAAVARLAQLPAASATFVGGQLMHAGQDFGSAHGVEFAQGG